MNKEQFELDIQDGNFYACKLNEAILALESTIRATKFKDGTEHDNQLKEWARYHIKRLMDNFELNWTPTVKEF